MENQSRQKQTVELHQRESRIITQTLDELRQTPLQEIQQLIHDQTVHEIELENQNRDLKRERANLEVSRKQCLDLYDFAPIAYFNLNSDGDIVSSNFMAGDFLRASRQELLNKSFKTFIEPQYHENFTQYLQDIVQSGRRERLEVEMRRIDGSRFYAHLQAVSVPEEKETVYRISAMDITQRKMAEEALQESEERFRNIFESSPIGIEIYDADGKLITLNRACLDIFGVTDLEQVKGFRLFEDPNLTPEVRERLLNRETVRWETPFDFELIKKNHLYPTSRSGIIFLDVLVTPLASSRNVLKGYLLQLQDITARKRMENDLQESIKDLQRLGRNTS